MPEIPVTETVDLLQKGYGPEDISRTLSAKGYTTQQIADALNQAQIKQGVGNVMSEEQMQPSIMENDIPLPPAQPQQQSYPSYPQPQSLTANDMQALVEQIIEEKWRDVVRDVGDLTVFRARVADDLEAVKQEMLRTQQRIDNLQNALLGKVQDYNDSVLKMGSDLRALEDVLSKILEPLTSNIRELSRVTEDLKKQKPISGLQQR